MKVSESILFPQIKDCPHRHYRNVRLTCLSLQSVGDYDISVRSSSSQWTIRRSRQQWIRLDSLIHMCLVERHFSKLPTIDFPREYINRLNYLLSEERALQSLKCVLILNWFESDFNGNHLFSQQSKQINERAIGAVLVVKEWQQNEENASEEREFLSLSKGDVISLLESQGFWAKGKKGLRVGLFPSECVRAIDESVARGMRRRPEERTSPLVVRRLQRLSSLLPQFVQKFYSNETQPEVRRHLPDSLRPRIFGRDLSEQLFDTNSEIPPVLSACTAFIEEHGLQDGIYRLSGVASNISRLRREFDAGTLPHLERDPQVMADVHCVSSCLKLFFRLLPNPLLTFESYDDFVSAVRDDSDDTRRLRAIRCVVRRLPPPHFRTARALMRHLRRVSQWSDTTGMTEKNLSIVWAPNLLRSKDIESRSVGADLAALQVIGIQAVLTEYLIKKFSQIFDDKDVTHETTVDDTNFNSRPILELKGGSFGRQICQRVTPKEKPMNRWKSFDSFFAAKDVLRLNFAKIQTFIDLIEVLPKFERKIYPLMTFWTTISPKSLPIVTTTTQTTEDDTIVVTNIKTNEDSVIVGQSARERIERIKAQRRQQLRQQFDSRPVPTPRRSVKKNPIPIPRRIQKNSKEEEIRILNTSARTKRNNWNENQIKEIFK